MYGDILLKTKVVDGLTSIDIGSMATDSFKKKSVT